jgi:hypothetical protein
MGIAFRKLKNEWLKEAGFRAEYERLKLEYALALLQTRKRISKVRNPSR